MMFRLKPSSNGLKTKIGLSAEQQCWYLSHKGLRNYDSTVRRAAAEACKGSKDLPLIRTIEPPKRVYKKCEWGVIVVAEIPADAQVRGRRDGKCRASKAHIIDILGDAMGKKIGVSRYAPNTVYEIGDDVVIENFDMSSEECVAGFHFFCTEEMAREYDFW